MYDSLCNIYIYNITHTHSAYYQCNTPHFIRNCPNVLWTYECHGLWFTFCHGNLPIFFTVLLYLTLHLSTCPMFSPQVCEKCKLQVARLISQNVWHQNISKSSKWLFPSSLPTNPGRDPNRKRMKNGRTRGNSAKPPILTTSEYRQQGRQRTMRWNAEDQEVTQFMNLS